MDASKRHGTETPMTETKNFITAITVVGISVFLCIGYPSPSSHGVVRRGPADTCTHSELHCRRESLSLGNPNIL